MVHYVFTLGWRSGERSNNGTSLILGRNGYTEVDSIYTDDINIKESIEIVKTKLSDYKFNKEHQYTDFKTGDKIAAVEIAALVATSFGVKGAPFTPNEVATSAAISTAAILSPVLKSVY